MSTNNPLIGITCSSKQHNGTLQQFLSNSYIKAITDLGGAPILIPTIDNKMALRKIYEQIDGLILSGGVDINPQRYKEQAAGSEKIDFARDEVEFHLINWALADDIPVLGICRGHQLLNVALSGSLYQDIRSTFPSAHNHLDNKEKGQRDYASHFVQIIPDSKLAQILNARQLQVNTLHHQAVKIPGKGLRVNALSDDGIIEGLESENHRWVISIQWHPEDLYTNYPNHARIFHSFLNELKDRSC